MAPPPTGGAGATTGEYVALSTVGDGASDEKSGPPRPSSPPPSAVAKGLDFIKKDLRFKFGAIFCGLWVLNWICELLRFRLSVSSVGLSRADLELTFFSVADPATK